MQRQIAVAFQGGGARLIGLIAAAHALSDLEKSLGIKIRAVSGSSAGSIAAFLLASNADFDRVKDAIRRLDPQIKKYFPRLGPRNLNYRILKFFLTGKPIYNPRHLDYIINQVLLDISINPQSRISDIKLSKKMFLMYSDIYFAASEPASETEIVRTAILRSCSLPVVFSTYKDAGGGQRVDGGILDNLPTDILMRDQTDLCPIFAIGFKSENLHAADSPSAYMHALATSGIQHRISSSKKAIGEDMVLELNTSLETLDFEKMVDVGIAKEYNLIQAQTRQFFQAYLRGNGNFTDPLSESRGLAPFFKLKSVEKSVHDYVYDSISKAKCVNEHLTVRVNAFSLANQNNYDEIYVEQVINFPEGDYIKGAILPMTNGAGYTADVECQVCIGGADGPEIKCEQFIINDYKAEFSNIDAHTNMVVLLFKGDLKPLIGKSVYILKKEKRYGFMLDLVNKKTDFLSIRSFYWRAKELSITLNVPKEFAPLRTEWLREQGAPGPSPEEFQPVRNLVPPGYACYAKALRNVDVGTRFKGNFYADRKSDDHCDDVTSHDSETVGSGH